LRTSNMASPPGTQRRNRDRDVLPVPVSLRGIPCRGRLPLCVQFQSPFVRTGDGISCIAGKFEPEVVRFSVSRYRHGTRSDACLAGIFALRHADVPRAVGEGGVSVIGECSAADVARKWGAVGMVVEIDRYGVGALRKVVFVVVV